MSARERHGYQNVLLESFAFFFQIVATWNCSNGVSNGRQPRDYLHDISERSFGAGIHIRGYKCSSVRLTFGYSFIK